MKNKVTSKHNKFVIIIGTIIVALIFWLVPLLLGSGVSYILVLVARLLNVSMQFSPFTPLNAFFIALLFLIRFLIFIGYFYICYRIASYVLTLFKRNA